MPAELTVKLKLDLSDIDSQAKGVADKLKTALGSGIAGGGGKGGTISQNPQVIAAKVAAQTQIAANKVTQQQAAANAKLISQNNQIGRAHV